MALKRTIIGLIIVLCVLITGIMLYLNHCKKSETFVAPEKTAPVKNLFSRDDTRRDETTRESFATSKLRDGDLITKPKISMPEEDFSTYNTISPQHEGISHTSSPTAVSPISLLSSIKQVVKGNMTEDDCLNIERRLDKYKDNVTPVSIDMGTDNVSER